MAVVFSACIEDVIAIVVQRTILELELAAGMIGDLRELAAKAASLRIEDRRAGWVKAAASNLPAWS